ncbi:alpha/beta hydrolase [Paucibacter sp. APW11]|uniref:Alpha/beta hydrolase n=1 Tax=Roseateles aquae TaxID=3077235 RepID=A0ABU3P514_9BURK|nr:alpha/beta hydrolase [Paucibacter sp. APW11]MDT8997671.1 alpha/beta hydrolase [Paucibacter sp. APW11]
MTVSPLQWAEAQAARLPYLLLRHAESTLAPLVFIHAGVCDHRMWLEQLSAFAAERTVLAYDRRGFGRAQTAAPTPHRWVDDLYAVLAAAGIERAIFVGCSQGGRIALDAALERPACVAGLVLIAPSVGGAPAPALAGRTAALQAAIERAQAGGDVDAINQALAALWLDGPLAETGRVSGAARELFLDMDGLMLRQPASGTVIEPALAAWDHLERVQAPCLVMWGDLDLPHLQQRCEAMVRRIPGARRCIMPGVAHLPSLEAPAAFNAALRPFLNGVDSANVESTRP